jgi:hypothetical protein
VRAFHAVAGEGRAGAEHARPATPASKARAGKKTVAIAVGSENAAAVARYLSWWDTPFEILASPELLAERYSAAAAATA